MLATRARLSPRFRISSSETGHIHREKGYFFTNLIQCLAFMVSKIYILFIATLFVLNFAGTLFSLGFWQEIISRGFILAISIGNV